MGTTESALKFHNPSFLKRAAEKVFGFPVVKPWDITSQLDEFKRTYPSVFGDQTEFDSFVSHAGYEVLGWWKPFVESKSKP